jgi:ABC-type multidrug transport system fused ATPase/permease subunit
MTPNIQNPQQDYLLSLIQRRLAVFERKQQRDKFLALGLKLLTAMLSACVTVALGITFAGKSESLYKNIALVLSATAAVLNTWDAFFNHRTLWIRHTVAANRLRSLKDELDYLVASRSGVLSEDDAKQVFAMYQQIMSETNQAWEDLRREDPTGVTQSKS